MRNAATAGEVIAQRIERQGPLRFDEFVDLALYHPDGGFYSGGGGAGRQRDFITSPEVGPLFGAVVARALDRWWAGAGRPDRFVVVEAGAGTGTLARAVRAARPACRDALDLVLVEAAAGQRQDHPPGTTSVADLPAPGELGRGPIVVVANELLDNVPFRLVERTAGGWAEVVVGHSGPAGTLAEGTAPLAGHDRDRAGRLAPGAALGSRIPLQDRAAGWVAEALALAGDTGRLVVFDYADRTAGLAARPWREWVRTYRGHGPGSGPLDRPGAQDITCEVAVDQLEEVRRPVSDTAQRAWLRSHGIDELVDEGRRIWSERAGIGDLAAVAGRSRVGEAQALLDPTGLGRFRVLEWGAADPG